MRAYDPKNVITRNGNRYNRNDAPKPANFDALVAAWNDPIEWSREVGVYAEQLRATGYEPSTLMGRSSLYWDEQTETFRETREGHR